MGSMTWEKMGRVLGPVSPTVTVSFREVTPKQDTWADFEVGRLNPAASWPWEPHQGSPANPDVLVSDERRLDRNKLVALKKQ